MPPVRPGKGRQIRRAAIAMLASGAALGVLATSALGRHAYVANFNSIGGTVSVLDSQTNAAVGAPITVGDEPIAIAITPDGSRAYVETFSSTVVIDTATNATVGSPLMLGTDERGVAITPDGSRAYVTSSGANSVYAIDIPTNTVIGSAIPVTTPWGIAITPDGSRAYVVTNATAGTVSVIDTQTNMVVGLPIAVGNTPIGIAITPDGSRVYVANENSNTVSVISTQSNAVIGTVTLPASSLPVAVAITPDGSRAYVADDTVPGSVSVINTQTNTLIGSPIPVSDHAFGVAITPDGAHAYAAGSSAVSVIETQTNTVVGSPIPVGLGASGVAFIPNQPPKPSFTARGKGLSVTLNGGATRDSDDQIGTFAWTFGDGSSAQISSATTRHAFHKVGEFTVTLTTSDGEGCPGFIYTGQTASCNGPSAAAVARKIATMKLGKLSRNTQDGTAALSVKVPGAGTLKLSGKGVAKQRPGARASSLDKAVHKGKVKLRIKAKGKKLRQLNRTGHAKLKFKVTFRPAGGGFPNVQSKRVKLVKVS